MAKTKRNRSEDMSEGGSEPESDDLKKNKRVKKLASDKAATKNDGNKDNADKFWELANPNRRATISSFKGQVLVSLREYYEKDGERLPGKKGIALSVEQYSALLSIIPEINAELANKGVSIGRENKGSDGGGEQPALVAAKRVKSKPKANIEATSDEDEE